MELLKKSRAFLLLFVTFFFWGSVYVGGKLISDDVPAPLLGCLRCFVASFPLMLMARKHFGVKIDRADWKYFAGVGVMGYFLTIFLIQLGISLTGASMASLVNSVTPVGVTIFAALHLKEKITPTKVLENEIGSGHTTDHGLSAFGKAVIPELERCGILVDVSHLNDPGFYDLLEVAQKPFLATHSNARAVCGHKRNLTDEMIREMVDRDCLIGLNYFVKFLRDEGRVESLDDLYRHVSHFLELGAAKNLALGSDFDGADLPDYLNSPAKAAGIYEYLLSRGIGQELADGIMFGNASRFFQTHLT